MKRLVFVIGLGVLCTVAWLVLRPPSVSRSLANKVRLGPGTFVDFAVIAPFQWDRVFVFGPYTPATMIEKSLGFPWPLVKKTSIERSDGVNLVVFVFEGQVVDWFEHPRNQGELIEIANRLGYSREEAKFTIYQASESRLVLAKPTKEN